MTKILRFTVEDVRFPTSKDLTGSDAIHTDPDYSATYVTAYTDDSNLKGYGIAFTIGKGNDIVAECIKYFFPVFETLFTLLENVAPNPTSAVKFHKLGSRSLNSSSIS